MFRFFRFYQKSKGVVKIIPYEKQYETRDFIHKHVSNRIKNYYQTEEFKQYKPNLKSTYK